MQKEIASPTLEASATYPISSGQIAARSGGQIAFDTYGDGPPLVLVHGAFSDHQTNWTYVKSLLAPHFRVYAIARRGRGATDAATDRALEDEFEDVAALIRLIGEPVFLLGHSYGAHVVLGTAASVPDLVRKLIVYEPAWPQLLEAAAMEILKNLADSSDWDAFAMAFFGDLLQVPHAELESLRMSDDWPPIVEDAAASYADIRTLAGYDFAIERFKDLPIPVLLQTGGESLSELWAVNRRANGTPYRRAKGTPFHDGARLIGHAPLRCARRREGGARPEARAAQSISYSEVSGGDQLRFLKRQLSLPVSTISQ